MGILMILALISCQDQSKEKQVVPGTTEDSLVTEKVDTVLSREAIRYFEDKE